MKYLCLIYVKENELEQLPGDRLEAVAQACMDYDQTLRQRGQLIAAERLESVQTATTLRVRNDRVSVTDGPFAETKEQLAGFYLLEAHDMNEAMQLATQIPPGRLGAVEVRPVRHLDVRENTHTITI